MENKFFVIPVADVTQDILDVCVQNEITRKDNDGVDCVLKLPLGTNTIPDILSSYTILTPEELKIEYAKDKWINPDIE